jgi:hypothetical protein
MIDRYFGVTASGSTVRAEIIAGVTTFLTMAYIAFVNPAILAEAGMDRGAVFVATCLAAALATLLMALLANYPLALAPGMGINGYFTYGVAKGLHYSWEVALGRGAPVRCAVPDRQPDPDPFVDRRRDPALAEDGDLGRHRPVSRGSTWRRRYSTRYDRVPEMRVAPDFIEASMSYGTTEVTAANGETPRF